MTGMVQNIFQVIGAVLESYATLLPELFENIVAVFYNAETGLTAVGILMLIGFGIGITKFAFNFIRDLVRL